MCELFQRVKLIKTKGRMVLRRNLGMDKMEVVGQEIFKMKEFWQYVHKNEKCLVQ